MLARAAQQPQLWPHLAALAYQTLCVYLLVRAGAKLFRNRVMKSGPQGAPRAKRGLFSRLRPARG
jgi:ABC-2 type transport system permease protein